MRMPLNPTQEAQLQSALRITRIITFALCGASPVVYLAVYGLVVLQGRWNVFLQGFAPVRWGDPVLLALLFVSASSLAMAFVLPGQLQKFQPRSQPVLAALRTRSIVACAMLESVSIFGLVLGFAGGPSNASLSLFLLLLPALLCPLFLPNEGKWRELFEQDLMRHDQA